MQNGIIYEQPLNERVRTFLRLEFLFDIIKRRYRGTSDLDSRDSINAMLDVIDLLSRSDLKSELIKELEKHASILSSLRENQNVDQQRLNGILSNINQQLTQLHNPNFQPGSLIKKNDLIVSVKQRSSIPGGSCNFDLPAYHHWLHKPMENRTALIEQLYADLTVMSKSVELSLHMLRNSTNPSNERAESGFFQKPIDGDIPCQLIRVVLAENCDYYPEISGGKHRFTIRFMQQTDTAERPKQSSEPVDFELHCCIL